MNIDVIYFCCYGFLAWNRVDTTSSAQTLVNTSLADHIGFALLQMLEYLPGIKLCGVFRGFAAAAVNRCSATPASSWRCMKVLRPRCSPATLTYHAISAAMNEVLTPIINLPIGEGAPSFIFHRLVYLLDSTLTLFSIFVFALLGVLLCSYSLSLGYIWRHFCVIFCTLGLHLGSFLGTFDSLGQPWDPLWAPLGAKVEQVRKKTPQNNERVAHFEVLFGIHL